MKTLIRADSSGIIGVGHIMRDIVLAQRLEGEIAFASIPLEGNIIDQIPYPVHTLMSNDPYELIELIRINRYERLVFDHYGIDCNFEKKVKDATGIEIMVLDDTYEKHHCDILLNHNISAKPEKYNSLVPEGCTLLCGEKHTLIRSEFIKEKSIVREKKYDLLIAMGGADTANKTLEILPSTENRIVAVLTTTANLHLPQLQTYAQTHPNVHLFINTSDVARIMNESKEAILTPSGIVHEALFMGLPFKAIQTARNQDDMVEYLKTNGYTVLESIG